MPEEIRTTPEEQNARSIPLLEVRNITKRFPGVVALNDVSLPFMPGEVHAVVGENGAGKSTLMKILTTYINADEGMASVNGHDVNTAQRQVQQSVGYLPEHNPLYLDLYVREYLAFNADVYKVGKSRIDEVIALTGLTPESHKKIGQLSKGYRQRVGLATALLHNPDVLILDEPTTGLDPNQLVEIRELIKNIGKDKTVFLSTHIMQEVEAICDRVIIINHGKIVTDKNMESLMNEVVEQTIEVEFDKVVAEELFSQLTHIKSFINTNNNIWELTFTTEGDMRPAVFDFAHDNGFKTLQLNLKNKNLEAIFREKTK